MFQCRGYGGIFLAVLILFQWYITTMAYYDYASFVGCVNSVSVPGLWWHIMTMHLLGFVSSVSVPGLWWHIMTMHLVLFQC